MSGPVRPPLAVEESSGSVIVRPANTIKFNAADFTVAKSGDEATISIDSTGTGAALTDTQIGFGNASNVMTSSADLTYTASTGTLLIRGTGTGTLVKMESTNAGASEAPDIVLYRNTASPAADDVIGSLQWSTNASDGTEYTAAKIESKVVDTTAGSENSKLQFYGGDQGGNQLVFEINGASDLVINPESSAFRDFSVKGDSLTILFSDSSQDNIGIGTGSPDSSAQLHVLDAGFTSPILIENTQTSTDDTVNIVKFYRNATGADGNTIGGFVFNAKDDGGTAADFASIKAYINDASSGSSRDGKLEWSVRGGNFKLSKMTMTSTEVVINQDSFGAPDFRCESNGNQNMFKVDANNDLVGVGAAPITTLKSDPPFQVLNQSAPASYEYLASSGSSPEQLTNNEMQGVMFAHASSSAHTYALPADGGIKGQHFYFFSTDGNITLDPAAGDTINGGSAGSTATFSTNNQIYHCVCYVNNAWIVSPPT